MTTCDSLPPCCIECGGRITFIIGTEKVQCLNKECGKIFILKEVSDDAD